MFQRVRDGIHDAIPADRACMTKGAFNTLGSAREAAERISGKLGEVWIPYWCVNCRRLHIGHAANQATLQSRDTVRGCVSETHYREVQQFLNRERGSPDELLPSLIERYRKYAFREPPAELVDCWRLALALNLPFASPASQPLQKTEEVITVSVPQITLPEESTMQEQIRESANTELAALLRCTIIERKDTVNDCARILGITENAVRNWFTRGVPPHRARSVESYIHSVPVEKSYAPAPDYCETDDVARRLRDEDNTAEELPPPVQTAPAKAEEPVTPVSGNDVKDDEEQTLLNLSASYFRKQAEAQGRLEAVAIEEAHLQVLLAGCQGKREAIQAELERLTNRLTGLALLLSTYEVKEDEQEAGG